MIRLITRAFMDSTRRIRFERHCRGLRTEARVRALSVLPAPTTHVGESMGRPELSSIQLWMSKLHSGIVATWAEQLRRPSQKSVMFDNRNGLKLPPPPFYEGAADAKAFELHVGAVCFHMRMAGLGGPDEDAACVGLYGPFLRGVAKDWYDLNVVHHARRKKQWTLVEVFIGLFDRFISALAIHQASADYEGVKYDATGGVDGLHTAMQTAANRMLDPPSEIEMRKQFMRLIPSFVRKELVKRDRLPEYTPLSVLVDTARLIEHGRRTLAILEGSAQPKDKRLQAVREVDEDSDTEGERMAYGRRQQDSRERRFFPRKNGGGDRDADRKDERRKDERKDEREYRRDGPSRERDRREAREDRRAPARPPKPPQPTWRAPPEQFRAATADPDRDERLAVVEDDEEDGAGYRSDYTIEEVSVASERSADEHLGFVAEDDVPELQDVSDSDEAESDDEFWSAAEDPELKTGTGGDALEQLAQEMAHHYMQCESVDETFEYFGAVRRDAQSTVATRKVALKTTKQSQPRPAKDWHKAYCLTAFVSINGKEAFTLFDSGCTTDAVSPDFARVAGLRVFPLETPMTLQLGTAGSRAKIVHGANAEVQYGGVKSSEYLDVVNIDRFDAILGTKFMRKHAIALDFEGNRIRCAGREMPTLSAETEHAVIERRAAARHAARALTKEMRAHLCLHQWRTNRKTRRSGHTLHLLRKSKMTKRSRFWSKRIYRQMVR
ncbi:Retrovirus-related Pol polyprotein from transposon 412 [Mycena chlorophos]|uniref:Retrovirus-related Pol polyprotein from transposon 412 n=1 Tax=Mycena chlorophos TaxID=658473 RepID=A0A8H6T099_MYCCL|nr:Retrovirus-related Pol polyprotein from transposon 412 [Mycena chlorophos]